MPFNKEAEVTIMIIINDLGVRLTHTLINGLKLVAYCNIVLLTKDWWLMRMSKTVGLELLH